MQQFYLAFITNAMIGLVVGFLWGLAVGYRAGLDNTSHKPHKARGSPKASQTDKDSLEGQNGSTSLTDPKESGR